MHVYQRSVPVLLALRGTPLFSSAKDGHAIWLQLAGLVEEPKERALCVVVQMRYLSLSHEERPPTQRFLFDWILGKITHRDKLIWYPVKIFLIGSTEWAIIQIFLGL